MTSPADVHGETCPDCDSPGIPIFYGDPPSAAYLTAQEHGRLVIGIAIGDNSPNWECSGSDCSLRWHGSDPLRAIQQVVREYEN